MGSLVSSSGASSGSGLPLTTPVTINWTGNGNVEVGIDIASQSSHPYYTTYVLTPNGWVEAEEVSKFQYMCTECLKVKNTSDPWLCCTAPFIDLKLLIL
jgi:hypothetical protein